MLAGDRAPREYRPSGRARSPTPCGSARSWLVHRRLPSGSVEGVPVEAVVPGGPRPGQGGDRCRRVRHHRRDPARNEKGPGARALGLSRRAAGGRAVRHHRRGGQPICQDHGHGARGRRVPGTGGAAGCSLRRARRCCLRLPRGRAGVALPRAPMVFAGVLVLATHTRCRLPPRSRSCGNEPGRPRVSIQTAPTRVSRSREMAAEMIAATTRTAVIRSETIARTLRQLGTRSVSVKTLDP